VHHSLDGSQSNAIFFGRSGIGLFVVAPADSSLDLSAELGFPAHFDATLHGSFSARLGAVDDESTSDLGKGGKEIHRRTFNHVVSDCASLLIGYNNALPIMEK